MSSSSRAKRNQRASQKESYHAITERDSGSPADTFGSRRAFRESQVPHDLPHSGQQILPPMLHQNTRTTPMFRGHEAFQQQPSGAGAMTSWMSEDLVHASGPLLSKAMTFPSTGLQPNLGTGQMDNWKLEQESDARFAPSESYEERGFVPYSASLGPSYSGSVSTHGPVPVGDASSRSYIDSEYPSFVDHLEGSESIDGDGKHRRKGSDKPHYSQRRTNKDEFDGPVQLLPKPPMEKIAAQEQELPHMPVNLDIREQDEVLRKVNEQLSQCAFDFIAKYQFPVPVEPDKRPVQKPGDREWTEWAYLIKRLATKRRIPARVLYNGQIKQLITILENSLEMRHASAHQSRPPKDDRNVLQLISAGIQVTKMLKDAIAMDYLDQLYQDVERIVRERRQSSFGHGM